MVIAVQLCKKLKAGKISLSIFIDRKNVIKDKFCTFGHFMSYKILF